MNKVKLFFTPSFWRFVGLVYWAYTHWPEIEDLLKQAVALAKQAEAAAKTGPEKRDWFNAKFQEVLAKAGESLKNPEFWLNALREIAVGVVKYQHKI